MKVRDYRKSNAGGIIVWLVIICIVGGTLYYLNGHPELLRLNSLTAPVMATPRPSPSPTPEAAPEPEPTPEATPTPTVTPSSTPTPTAEATPLPPAQIPPDFSTIAGTPALWPRQVVLLKPTAFPIVFNGKVAGQTQAPAGVTVRLVRVLPDLANPQVEVEFQNSRALLAASSTDLATRAMNLREAAAARAVAAPSATVQPPTPVAAATPAPVTQSNELFAAEALSHSDNKDGTVTLNVKVFNNTAVAYAGLKGTVYTLAESLLNPDNVKVIGITVFSFPMPINGRYEKTTDKADPGIYEEDLSAARYGFKYIGWLLRLTDKTGKVIYEKASTPDILNHSGDIANLPFGGKYTTKP